MKLRAAKFLTGLLLLPLCLALSMTLWRAIVILAQSPTRLPLLHAFAGVSGIVLWAVIWIFLPPMTRTYVLGHELTHALWAMLFGGKASGLKVTDRGLIWNTDLLETLELDNLIGQATVTVVGAHNRTESRGAHAHEDYPDRNDQDWMKHTLTWFDDVTGKVRIDDRPVHSYTMTNDIAYIPPKARVY